MLYIAIGIIGATVMPHNLYLHSSIVQTRAYDTAPTRPPRGDQMGDDGFDHRADAGAVHQRRDPDRSRPPTFHASGRTEVAEIGQAYELLSPLLGLGIAARPCSRSRCSRSGLNSRRPADRADPAAQRRAVDVPATPRDHGEGMQHSRTGPAIISRSTIAPSLQVFAVSHDAAVRRAAGAVRLFRDAGHAGTVDRDLRVSGGKGRFFGHVRKPSANWDGSDPCGMVGS